MQFQDIILSVFRRAYYLNETQSEKSSGMKEITMNTKGEIIIAAAVVTDAKGRCLLVRKRGTLYFIQPGGKPETSELPQTALIRELKEEINFAVLPEELTFIGRFSDAAANEAGYSVSADIFHIRTDKISFEASAEIEEVIWFDPQHPHPIKLAPLTENHLLPLLKNLKF